MDEVAKYDKIDELEVALLENFPKVDCPLIHRFTPGVYSREIFMPAGAKAISRIHNTMHFFVISAGKVSVKINDEEAQILEAPYTGITMPDTRRVILVLEDTVWTTFHPTSVVPEDHSERAILEAVDKIDSEILSQRENPLFGMQVKNNKLINSALYVQK